MTEETLRAAYLEVGGERHIIERAESLRRTRGGTLDTALLECGADAVSVERALVRASGYRLAPADLLEQIDPEATSALPVEIALRERVVPLAIVGTRLRVASS